MISIGIVLALLLAHWVSDFVFQTDYQALNKSTSNWALAEHVGSYSTLMFFLLMLFNFARLALGYTSLCTGTQLLAFCGITFIAHFITDYFTSRANARLWKAERRHDFFVMVGFDQFLHYAQLLITYKYLLA